jgi:hypothetical protein
LVCDGLVPFYENVHDLFMIIFRGF